jgi:ABC-type bacteriocin/lantibiotic exporter with double-glycine peptidase domain
MSYFFLITKKCKLLTASVFAARTVQALYFVAVSILISRITDMVLGGTAQLGEILIIASGICVSGLIVCGTTYQVNDLWKVRLRRIIEYRLSGYASYGCGSATDAQNAMGQEAESMITSYFSSILSAYALIVQFIAAVAAALFNSWIITLLVLAFVVISLWISNLPGKKLADNFQAVQNENKNVLLVTGSVVNASLDLRVYGAQKFAHEYLLSAVVRRLRALRVKGRFQSGVETLNDVLSTITQFGLIIAALIFVMFERISFANMMALFLLMQYINGPLNYFLNIKNTIDSTHILRKKFKVYEDIYRETSAHTRLQKADEIQSIRLSDVSFHFEDGVSVLNGINITINRGDKVLILGNSGSGKSTLLRIILRDLEPTGGIYQINGIDSKQVDPSFFYNEISIIGQRSTLLPISLGKNLALSEQFDRERVTECLNTVNLNGFDADYLIDESFGNLSEGEMQRMLLARMLYQRRKIFVLDEFTASLDPKNSYDLESLILGMEDKTILHVTHKINPELLIHYNTLIILQNGNLAYYGAMLPPEDITPYYS